MGLPQLRAAQKQGFFSSKESRKPGVLDLRLFKPEVASLALYSRLLEMADVKDFSELNRLRDENQSKQQKEQQVKQAKQEKQGQEQKGESSGGDELKAKVDSLIRRIPRRGLLLVVGTPHKPPEGA